MNNKLANPGALALEKGASGDAKFCTYKQKYVINSISIKRLSEIGFS